jgi:diacylglycerol kinase (ATP)
MSLKVKLIFNPIANLGQAWSVASRLRPIANELGGAEWTGTEYHTHATELSRKAAEDGYDLVVAMGGDGTMHEVLNGLMQVPAERRPKMGVVPLGSGNDFAFACGVSPNPEEALQRALTGTSIPIDIGSVTDNHGHQEYWANAIGIGFDTIVTLNSRKIRLIKGFGAYFISVVQAILFQYEPFKLDMKLDGQEWSRSFVLLVLMNGKREGGGFHVTPDAKPDDGVLDLLGVDRVSRLRMLRILPEIMKGTQSSLPDCSLRQFKNIEIESDRPLYIHADGEIMAIPSGGTKSLSIQIIEKGIQVVR